MGLSSRSVKFIPGKRAGVKEDPKKEGIIEVRPGTNGIDLGEKKYARAYIRVLDEHHCFKGMCIYSNALPDDYDIICYFRDPSHGLTVLRTVTPEMNLGKDIMTIIKYPKEEAAWNFWEAGLRFEQKNKGSNGEDTPAKASGGEQCEESGYFDGYRYGK